MLKEDKVASLPVHSFKSPHFLFEVNIFRNVNINYG